MQVEYETQLIENNPVKALDFTPKENQPLDVYTLTQVSFGAIEFICCCPIGNVIALYLQLANQVVLIDTKTYVKREKFPLKSCNKKFSRNSFFLKAIDFSPDGTRLAIGQSDCIIYIYKLASQPTITQSDAVTSAKTVLTGKFVCSSPVTCLLWTDYGIIFGTQDGKIKLVQSTSKGAASESQASSTKVISVYNSPESSMPLSLANKSQVLAIGFVDCTIVLININADLLNLDASTTGATLDPVMSRRSSSIMFIDSFTHSCPPYNMIMIQNNILCCAGSNGKLSIYLSSNQSGEFQGSKLAEAQPLNNKQQVTNLIQAIDLKDEIVALDYSPANEILAAASSKRLLFIRYDQDQESWKLQSSFIEFTSIGSLTSFKWTRDGSQFVVGNLSGQLELFKCTWSKQSIGDQLDVCHIAKNKVRITDRARNLLATYKSAHHDIKRVNLLDAGQSVIIWTSNSLILARLGQSAQSEIPWGKDRNVKFCFDHPGFVFIFSTSTHQLSLVRLGEECIVYSAKFETSSKSIICARQYPPNLVQSTNEYDKVSPIRSARSARSRNLSISGQQESIMHLNPSGESPTINSDRKLAEVENERLALVVELNLLVIVNLKCNSRESRYIHSASINWIELSYTSNYIVFRDTQDQLYFIDLGKDENSLKSQLVVAECSFAKWIPESDILIAQSSYKIQLWFNVNELNKPSLVIDSRSYNITKTLPILDLSLVAKAYPVISRLDSNYSLLMSNGQSILLDSLQIRFYSKVCENNLDSAHEILKKEDGDVKMKHLWNKLGWLAIERYDCDTAIKVFNKTGYEKMINYLEKSMENPEETEWRLAMLRGDWVAFEELVAKPEQIVSTYKRLNKWSLALDFLTRTQQFRQRDFVELEYKEWLIKEERYAEAAKIQAKSGDILGGVELLMSKEFYEDAASLLVNEKVVSNQTNSYKIKRIDENLEKLAKNLIDELVALEKYEKAGLISDKILSKSEMALELYVKGKKYDMALELAKKVNENEERIIKLEELAGDELMLQMQTRPIQVGRKKALKAIEHFIRAGNYSKSLNAAMKLGQFEKGFDILLGLTEEEKLKLDKNVLKEHCKLISNFKLKQGKVDDAIEVLLKADEFDEAISLLIERSRLEDAYRIALMKMNSSNREATDGYFIELATKLAYKDTDAIEKAEKIYLMLERPDLAIKLHREVTKNYERMLELVEKFQVDQVEATLLTLARELESIGDLESAERYLLRLSESEWTNVVRMYRLAGKWSDAFRVAKDHCVSDQDPLLVQLANWWSKSLVTPVASEKEKLDYSEAHKLLQRLNLFEAVLEFCCENKNFPMALGLSNFGSPELRQQVSRRYASFLEEQQNFERAEWVLVESGDVEGATKMYLDNDMPSEALRLVEGQLNNSPAAEMLNEDKRSSLTELLNRTLISCADRIAGEFVTGAASRSNHLFRERQAASQLEEKLLVAQQMYLRAQRPELAVAMYRERGMWQVAIQVAQRFAPQLVEGVESALDEQLARDLPLPEKIINSGKDKPLEGSPVNLFEDSIKGHSKVSRSTGNVRKSLHSGHEEPEPEPEPVEYLRSQVELHINEGNLNKARSTLNKFLDSLVEGGDKFQNEASTVRVSHKIKQLDLLLKANQAAIIEATTSHETSEQLIWKRVLYLSDWVFSHCTWLGQLAFTTSNMSAENRLIWFQLRDLLFRCVQTKQKILRRHNNNAQVYHDAQVAALGRHLLVAHWIILLGCISSELDWTLREESLASGAQVRQQVVLASRLERLRGKLGAEKSELLDVGARLALSLLRYTDEVLDVRQALYVTGSWCLAANRVKMGRLCWTRLLEILSMKEEIMTPAESQLKLLGMPEKIRLIERKNSIITEQQVGDVRNWLLETLISNENSGELRVCDEKFGFKESKSCSEASFSLISGIPLNDQELADAARRQVVQLGEFCVYASELRILESASRRQSERGARSGIPKELLLRNLLEFMSNELSKVKLFSY